MKKLLLLSIILFSLPSWAKYNANHSSVVSGVFLYSDGDYIYIQLADRPEHEACNNAYFVIHETVPYERRQMMLSRLLLAYATKEKVNFGYDGTGECAHGFVRVHRVG